MQRFLSRDGTVIACSTSGSGPPLLLVHGSASDRTRWAPILPAFGERFTVLAVDRRGRGESGDGADHSIEREADDLAAIVEGLGGPVDVFAHSFGAICALEAAPRLGRLRKLVLYEPPLPTGTPIAPPGLLERLEQLLAAGDREGVVTTFLREAPRLPPHELERLRAAPAWPGRVAAAHTLVRELRAHEAYRFRPESLAGVAAPTLLLLGGDSPPFFRVAQERVLAALPSARLCVLPGQQHVAMDTAPELLTREVLDFLGDPAA